MILVLLLCILPRSRSSISSNYYASIAFHEPWGFYQAESYDDTTGVWTESQGNIGRNANSVGAGGITTLSKKGHGASSEITSINGDTSSEILWPDFTDEDMNKAIEFYLERDRRYGKLQSKL